MKASYVLFLILVFHLSLFAQEKKIGLVSSEFIVKKKIDLIAFGSCSKENKPQKQLWKEVGNQKANLWIWLGDNIYADTEDMNLMKKKYRKQKNHPDYRTLTKNTDVIGIWDDHDYGMSDSGKEYPYKEQSKSLLFDFLDVPKKHPAWNRLPAYQSYFYDFKSKRITIILLDARYDRDELKKDENGINIPNNDGKVLSDNQWNWLSNQLSDDKTNLFIICSGIQIISDEHRFEKWGNFPDERKKLLNLVRDENKPVILLTGDRHFSEVAKTTIENYSYPLYEITSSGLTSALDIDKYEENRYRVEKPSYKECFATLKINWKRKNISSLEVNFIGKNDKVLNNFQLKYH